MAHAWKMAEEAAETLQIPNGTEGLSEEGASPIIALQSEWAEKLLHGVLDALQPTTAPPAGLVPTEPSERSLTELEARQLMSMLDPASLEELVAESEERPAWNMPARTTGTTASQLMALSGTAANLLRQRYDDAVVLQKGTLS